MFDESEFSENDRKKTALCPGKTNGVALSDAVGKPCALRFAPFAPRPAFLILLHPKDYQKVFTDGTI
ncbi:MAG: hypothetical protein GX103_11700 [Bacteroidales bacterium]|jgi:hypothetical protein|nr:hypothetical protein [Bacteroidales bacterium]NLO51807.1 hypothetical protein [Bacteroidales bacterium]